MKIIAKSGDDTVLIEATRNEVALLGGLTGRYDDKFQERIVGIGAEIDITKMVKIANYVKSLDNDKLKEVRRDLEDIIVQVDNASETVSKLNLFEVLKT